MVKPPLAASGNTAGAATEAMLATEVPGGAPGRKLEIVTRMVKSPMLV